jgi:dTDP-4-amino-4,6-dideoxygalactose transaminase
MNKKRIWLSSPHMGKKEIENINNAFETNWISPLGPHVDGFEKDLCRYNKVNSAVALSSGTAAIHLALILLNVGIGDEVICQSFTFSASANPIAYQGATPVFVDSETDTWNMCPTGLRKAVIEGIARGKKPKAIIIVHLYGMPAKMHEILSISEEFDIPLIEDAAEALGSLYKGEPCGSIGYFGVLSFNGNKIITTSGGGALLSSDNNAIQKARFLATQARDQAPHYQHSHIGYNYRMSNICAGIGRGQMEVLNERIMQRRGNFDLYKKELGKVPGIKFLDEQDGLFSNRWLTCILIDNQQSNITTEVLRKELELSNIETRPLWKPMHLQPIFKDCRYYGENVAESLFKIGLCLPSGSNLTEEDIYYVINNIKYLIDKFENR